MKELGAKISYLYLMVSTVVIPYGFASLSLDEAACGVWFFGLVGFFLLIPLFVRLDKYGCSYP